MLYIILLTIFYFWIENRGCAWYLKWIFLIMPTEIKLGILLSSLRFATQEYSHFKRHPRQIIKVLWFSCKNCKNYVTTDL